MKLRTRQLILSFVKTEDTENFKRILARRGWFPAAVCVSGAHTLSALMDCGESLIICGYRLSDMGYAELAASLPDDSTILLIANPARVEEVPDNVVFLPMPVKPQEFLSTVELLTLGITPGKHSRRGSSAARSDAERRIVEDAKGLLMERHHMSEPEAHRYLQKTAMDNGCDLIETAQMLLAMG